MYALNLSGLPGYQHWRKHNREDFSLDDYLASTASIEQAIAFTRLFWPDFLIYQNGIFFSGPGFNTAAFQAWSDQLNGDIPRIEQVMNHAHLHDLLPGAQEVSRDNLHYLAQTLCQCWKARLEHLFPYHPVQVYYQDEGEENGLVLYVHQPLAPEE
jgi:hypothetical protein